MSKASKITKEIWDGLVSLAKVVCGVCAIPAVFIAFLKSCGENGWDYHDPTKGLPKS